MCGFLFVGWICVFVLVVVCVCVFLWLFVFGVFFFPFNASILYKEKNVKSGC